MKTLAIFYPYELVAGGGTRYMLSIADAMRQEFQVYVVTPSLWDKKSITKVAAELGLNAVHVNPITWEHAFASRPFSVAIAISNESLPPVPAIGHKNIYLCQFPFPFDENDVPRRLSYFPHYDRIVVYSDYTKSHLKQQLRTLPIPERPIDVIHPAVDPMGAIFSGRRARTIVSVGRFVPAKRQHELIDIFSQLRIPGSSLHLAGAIGSRPEHVATYRNCQQLAQDLPVSFYPNASRSQIGLLYRQASCYWHGHGLGADPIREPQKHEHFGISVVEAMSAGCIPFVLGTGGPAEIVTSGRDGWIYNTPNELIELTSTFFTRSNYFTIQRMRAASRQRARSFRRDVFNRKWRELTNDVVLKTERRPIVMAKCKKRRLCL